MEPIILLFINYHKDYCSSDRNQSRVKIQQPFILLFVHYQKTIILLIENKAESRSSTLHFLLLNRQEMHQVLQANRKHLNNSSHDKHMRMLC